VTLASNGSGGQGLTMLAPRAAPRQGGAPGPLHSEGEVVSGSGRNKGPAAGGLPVEKGDEEGVDEWHGVPFYKCTPWWAPMACK
jgi:hypothetical protein